MFFLDVRGGSKGHVVVFAMVGGIVVSYQAFLHNSHRACDGENPHIETASLIFDFTSPYNFQLMQRHCTLGKQVRSDCNDTAVFVL